MSNTAIINIKIDSKVKKEAQKVAAELGLSLSAVIIGFLKQLVRTRTVLLTLDDKDAARDFINKAIEIALEDKENKKKGVKKLKK